MEILGQSDRQTVAKCVGKNTNFDHEFLIRSHEIIKLNVTVVAELDSSFPEECGPEFLVNKR